MKITVGDVVNSEVDVREYMSADNGVIYVDFDKLDVVLIDKSEEWNLAATKDKQALIKSAIALNKRVEQLELEIETLGAALYDAKHEVRILKGRLSK